MTFRIHVNGHLFCERSNLQAARNETAFLLWMWRSLRQLRRVHQLEIRDDEGRVHWRY